MKQTVITMMLMLVALTTSAQEKNRERLAENFFNAKVAELALRLNMTEEQKEKFIPIYRRYNDEMKATFGPRKLGKGDRGPKAKKDGQETQRRQEESDEEVLAKTKRHIERQQQAQAIQLKYVDEFATVLSAKQVSKLFQVEKDIAKKIAKRKGHRGEHHGQGGMGRHPHSRPDNPQN